MEIWKDIKGFEGLYVISNLGNIKCLEHKCPGRYKGKFRTVKEHIMKPTLNKTNGYYYVVLSNSDRGRTFAVHRLVAQAFLDNPENLPCVNHKDENRKNNTVENLEWCTSLYNNTYNNVHKKRKRYSHRYEYEIERLLEKIKKLSMEIEGFKTKYPNVEIEPLIQELKSQRQNGKQKNTAID